MPARRRLRKTGCAGRSQHWSHGTLPHRSGKHFETYYPAFKLVDEDRRPFTANFAMSATDAGGAWAPLRRQPFRALWIAQFVSNVGTWMQSVGAVWVMVDLKASPTEIALVQTATTLPVVCFGFIGGALADLVDRRRVLLVTQAIMLVAARALAWLDSVGTVTHAPDGAPSPTTGYLDVLPPLLLIARAWVGRS